MLDPNKTVSISSTKFQRHYGDAILTELSKDDSKDTRPYVIWLNVPQGASLTHGEKRMMALKLHNSKLLTKFARVNQEQLRRFVQQILICMHWEYAANAEVEVPWTKAGKMRTIRVSRQGDDLDFRVKP